jgi:hypothetical protein
MKKYRLTFQYTDTEQQAQQLVKELNATATPYQRRRYPAHYTPVAYDDWAGFIVWYHN